MSSPVPQDLSGIRLTTLADEPSQALRQAIAAAGGQLTVWDFETQSATNPELADFGNEVLTGGVDTLLLITGPGTREILSGALRTVPRKRFLQSLDDLTIVSAGPQATQALSAWNLEPTLQLPRLRAPGNSPWRDILMGLDRQWQAVHQRIAIEATADVNSLVSGLEARGADVLRLRPYHHQLPHPEQAVQPLFEQIEAGDDHGFVFSTAAAVSQFVFLARHFGRAGQVRHLLDQHLVLAGPEAAELLRDYEIAIDYVWQSLDASAVVDELRHQIPLLQKQKTMIRNYLSGPASSAGDQQAPWYDSPFMRACRGEPTEVTPIWMMRQAGRYMAEYRAVRDKVSFLELCANPQLCSEVMCTAVERLGVDAAIIFSDLLPMLVPMGCQLEFVKGDGPVIHNPVRTAADVDRIRPLENMDELDFVVQTVRQTRADLPEDLPLIGFSGAPFTLASYMIEGGASRNYAATKQLMYTDRGAWDQLMQHLTQSVTLYLASQIEAGAQCVQLFDSWAGCLSFEAYRQFVLPYVQQILAALPANVPVINFATGNPALLPLLADTRAAVIGVDWRVRLDDAWQTVGYDRAVQGNLDPVVLLTDPAHIRQAAKAVLDQAAGRPGHIFNLGHGILPQTPVDNAIALVDSVHELSARNA